MARKALILKSQKKPKFSARQHNRCKLCGRSKGYLRRFGVCRLCFREMAWRAEIPGVKKASW